MCRADMLLPLWGVNGISPVGGGALRVWTSTGRMNSPLHMMGGAARVDLHWAAGMPPLRLEGALRAWTSTGRMNSPLHGLVDPGGVAYLSPGCLHPGNRSPRLSPTLEGSRRFPVPMPGTFAP